MDPFTEKLLERTRARRENLQKKMSERPTAANRQMVKRAREPLADTNSVISEPVIDKETQAASKPSPSKRRYSEENIQPVPEENQEPLMTRPAALMLQDPLTVKKTPTGLPKICPSSSMGRTVNQPAIQSPTEQLQTPQPDPETAALSPAPAVSSSREAEMLPAGSARQRKEEDVVEGSALSATAAGMKTRLQRLAEQRKCWDGDVFSGSHEAVSDCTPLTMMKRQVDAPPAAVITPSSEAPLGRRGRLANLAATIGSWEDNLSHVAVPKANTQGKFTPTSGPKFACRDTSVAVSSKPREAQGVGSSLKSSSVVPASPQNTDIPATKPRIQSVNSPQNKSFQGCSASPQDTCSTSTPVPQRPVKNQGFPTSLSATTSPQKIELSTKPTTAGPTTFQNKSSTGAPVGVKSFLERFGERCQERSPVQRPTKANTPTSVTPNTRLMQEKLRAAQTASTATADLTQRQKLERECELAQIRSRLQKGNNVWKDKDDCSEIKKNTEIKEQLYKPECGVASCEPHEEPTSPSAEIRDTPTTCTPPASASSPLRTETPPAEKTSVDFEVEMNVDQSINSDVINELFDGILAQSADHGDEEEEGEEEDALNISSMSLLTPLAEVVRSPDRQMMTSTPSSSFIVKNNTPELSKVNTFQRTNTTGTASSDRVDISDEDHMLPYSIDAYRSTRVKEADRPSVKQVIVRKEDVSHRAQEPRSTSHFSIKQKLKILTNEINLQQTVIHQASQALNCCKDEEHGKGSQVEAEAERLLLVATERRGALKAELDRLKGEKPTGGKAAPEHTASKGSITLQEFRLPLKADFVCSTANKPDSTKHSFFIMIRAGAENTVATPLASTHRGLSGDTLTFTTKFMISDISSDFEIDIEVYNLVQKREVFSEKRKKPSKSK
ncbi:anillin, partial [Thalassophryne amazonica]|uniref:anillin n=1 Tax=Thalassophryne amazonica TaxID=390379 RepID=UPI0014710144